MGNVKGVLMGTCSGDRIVMGLGHGWRIGVFRGGWVCCKR